MPIVIVCEIHNNELGCVHQVENIINGLDLIMKKLQENNVPITQEVTQEVEETHGYINEAEGWSIQLGITD